MVDDPDAIPDLDASLVRHGLVSNRPRLGPTGPRRWWGGPLDVEGLALASVGLAARAVDQIVGVPDSVSVDSADVAAAFASQGHLRVNGVRPVAFAELSGFFATADGWIRTHGNYPHHAQRLRDALAAQTKSDVAARLSELSSAEAERRITDAGGIAAAVASRSDWVNAATVPIARPDTWIDVTFGDIPPSQARTDLWTSPGSVERPLAGLRVLDLTRVIAGPTGSRVLAALGADVLRVDPPSTPELTDQHIDTGFGKRTVTADLNDADTLATVRSLLEAADVVINGYRNGGLDRFGLAPATLRASHPHLVVVSLDAWGDTGPRAQRRGFDSIVQAATGISMACADDTGHPGALPVQALDHATGYGVVAAAISLAHARSRDGRVGHAHLSLARSADILFGIGVPTAPIDTFPAPVISTCDSEYGTIDHVLPPLRIADRQLSYPYPAHILGSDSLEWLPR